MLSAQHLGVSLDLGGLPKMFAASRKLAGEIVSGWGAGADELSNLIFSWVPDWVWPGVRGYVCSHSKLIDTCAEFFRLV